MNRRDFLLGWTQRPETPPKTVYGIDELGNIHIKGGVVIDGTLRVTPPGANIFSSLYVGIPTPIPSFTVNPFSIGVKEEPLELLIGERVDNV